MKNGSWKIKIALGIMMGLGLNASAWTDQETVAITILAEARGEGQVGMHSIAAVIAQRSIERKISGAKVCTQKWQFSCWNKNDPQYAKLGQLLKLPQAKYAMQLAGNLGAVDRSTIGFANHYHTFNVTPAWSKNKTPVKVLGHHKFFKL